VTGTVVIAARFNGPRNVANGGFACGTLADLVAGTATVRLCRPVPLARPLDVDRTGGDIVLESGGTVVAVARSVPSVDLAVPEQREVSESEARVAAAASLCRRTPPVPGCFVCGPTRARADGLRIFAGRIQQRELWAAPWTAEPWLDRGDGRVAAAFVWAALDCPSGFAAVEHAFPDTRPVAVLGQMTATIASLPTVGSSCVIVAWPLGRDGRKRAAGSALLSNAGHVLAAARTVWLTVPTPDTGELAT
jgi:hypothetical protein